MNTISRSVTLGLVVFGLFRLVAAGQDQGPRPKSESDNRIPSLKSRATEAKAAGRCDIAFSTPVDDPVFTAGLLDISSKYSIVIASVAAQETLVGRSRMFTWYVLQVESYLIRHGPAMPSLKGVDGLPETRRPRTLLPLTGSDTLLIEVPGGSTVIDGVTVSEREPEAQSLLPNKRYVFILDISEDGTMGYLPTGFAGVFAIGADGEMLSPLSTSENPVTDDVKAKFNTVSKAKAALAKANAHPQ